MTSEHNDLKELRSAWSTMGKSLPEQPADNDTGNLNGRKTALDRLRDRYRRFRLVSALLIFGSFMIFSRGQLFDSNLNLYLGIAYAAYFATSCAMDYVLWRGLGTIDPVTMSVTEVARHALRYRKLHLQFIAILLPLALGLLGFTAYAFSADRYFLYGMLSGAIIGAAIGTFQFRRFMADYRRLSE